MIVHLLPLAENKFLDLGVVNKCNARLKDQIGGLKQIIENAITNAIHYSPEKGRIDISVTRENEEIVFVVEDQGPGIAEHALEKVCEPFFRAENNNSAGNGLGLAICTEIAKRLGGEIKLTNRQQGGLKFSYIQPAYKQPENNI